MIHIGINGFFLGQETTGSGQYLCHLLEQMVQLAAPVRYSIFVPPAAMAGTAAERILDLAHGRAVFAPLPTFVPMENLDKLWMEQVAFPRTCRRGQVDVAHVPYFASPWRLVCPTVVTVHDLIPLVLPAYRGDLRVRLYTRLVAATAQRAAAVITDSRASKDDIVRLLGVPAERVHVIYLATEAAYGVPVAASARDALCARYDLPERFLLYLGGFDQRRNIRTLLDAFAQMVKRLQGRDDMAVPILALAGGLPREDTGFTPDPRRMARELGITNQVRFLGRVDEADKPALLQAAEIFCFPSIYEGFGLTPLEAMTAGTPVIAADATSLPEIVGDGGVLVPPQEVDAWAAAMMDLWQHPEQRAALRERAVAQGQRFSWQRTAEQTLAVYLAVASQYDRI